MDTKVKTLKFTAPTGNLYKIIKRRGEQYEMSVNRGEKMAVTPSSFANIDACVEMFARHDIPADDITDIFIKKVTSFMIT